MSIQGQSPAIFDFSAFVLGFICSAVVALMFINTSHLKERISLPTPFSNVLLVGLLFSLFSMFITTWYFNMQFFGPPPMVIFEYIPLINTLAHIFLTIGVVKVLLSAQPLTHHSSGTG